MKPTQACRPENLHYLKMLARQYPTVQAASTEIINLQAILNLPKGTEHFVSDVHGEYEAFLHILNSASGVVREKLDDLFAATVSKAERDQLATLIYYPKEKLEEIISYNVSNEKKWYIRITPLFIKWLALGVIFRRHDKAHTATLSNLGLLDVDEDLREQIEGFQMMIGVSARQPFKCGVCAFGDRLAVTFTSVIQNSRIQDSFFEKLKQDGIEAELESNGPVRPELDKGHYPLPYYNKDNRKRMGCIFWGVLAALSVMLAVINAVTYSGLWWSGIAIFGMLYVWLTIRYSILRHANLGKSVLLGTIGIQALMLLTDRILGYGAWSINYGIPASILFVLVLVVLGLCSEYSTLSCHFIACQIFVISGNLVD